MKASLSYTILLLLSTAACCCAAPFEPRRATTFNPPRSAAILHSKQRDHAVDTALLLRGGGVFGTPVTKENLATLYTLCWGALGVIGMPAPEKQAELFGFSLGGEASLAHVLMEMFASTCLGIGIMSYLAVQSNASATKIAMCGALSCFYATFRNTLKGTFDKLGFMDYFGVIQLVVFSVCSYCIQTGTGDAMLAAKVLSVFPLIYGVVGSIAPDVALKVFCGLPKQTGVAQTISFWFFQGLLGWGVLSWSLLSGESAFKSIGLASLALAVGVIDNTFIRKANEGVISDALSYTYLASAASIAAGLLLG